MPEPKLHKFKQENEVMEEMNIFAKIRFKQVERIVEQIYRRLVNRVIADIRALPDNCRQSGDDSKLKDVWEEYKYQLQGEEFGLFEMYEQLIEQFCRGYIADIHSDFREILWLWSEYFDYWNDEDDKDLLKVDVDGELERELFKRINNVACNEPLEVDPDEDRDRDRYERDKEPFSGIGETSSEGKQETTPSETKQPGLFGDESRFVKLKGSWEHSAHTIEIKPDGSLVAEVYDFSGSQGGDYAWGVTVAKETQPQLLALLQEDPIFQDRIEVVDHEHQLERLLPLFADRFHCFDDLKSWLEDHQVPYTEYTDPLA